MQPVGPIYSVAQWFVSIGPAWWSAIFTLIGAVATFSAVLTAFILQDRLSKREARTRRDEELKLEVSAIRMCEASLTIYDSIFNPKKKPEFRYKSDTSKRLFVMKSIVDHYSHSTIHDAGLLSTVVTTQTLMAQTIEDINSINLNVDQIEFEYFEKISEHRKDLVDGLRKMVSECWQKPAYPKRDTGQTHP